MVWRPAGSQTVSALATGHVFPSTIAGPDQCTPEPRRDCTEILPAEESARSTVEAEAASSGQSSLGIELSKYSATRGNASEAWCTSSYNSAPVCCLVG